MAIYLQQQSAVTVYLVASQQVADLRRVCKLVDWLVTQTTALQDQIIALDRLVWLGGRQDLVFNAPCGPAARWCRQHYFDPRGVVRAGAEVVRPLYPRLHSSRHLETLMRLSVVSKGGRSARWRQQVRMAHISPSGRKELFSSPKVCKRRNQCADVAASHGRRKQTATGGVPVAW